MKIVYRAKNKVNQGGLVFFSGPKLTETHKLNKILSNCAIPMMK